jgi:CheY-like chemotaxis protein
MHDLSYLIADPGTNRSVLKQLLNQWKIPPARIRAVDSGELAKAAIEAVAPNVVILDAVLLESADLVEAFNRSRTNESVTRIFILLAAKENAAYLDSLLDDRIDGVIPKPFTLQSLSDRLGEILRSKTNPNPYEKAIEAGRTVRRVDPVKALQVFALAEKLNPAPALACWHQGDVYRQNGNFAQALEQFKRGVSFQKDHLRCVEGAMNACFELGHQATGSILAQYLWDAGNFPVKGVPDWAKAALAVAEYNLFPKLYDYLDSMHALKGAPARSLAEGLIAYSQEMLLPTDPKAAAGVLKKAEVCAQGDIAVLSHLAAAMFRMGMESEGAALIGRSPAEVKQTSEVRLAEFQLIAKRGSATETLQHATELLKLGVQEKELFLLAIEKSRELNRRPEVIEELLFQARKLYPDAKEFSEN